MRPFSWYTDQQEGVTGADLPVTCNRARGSERGTLLIHPFTAPAWRVQVLILQGWR